MFATSYPLLDLFLTMLWFFLFFIWIWLLISIFSDIFRSHDMGGGQKTLWVLLVLFLPYLGAFVYLIARGGSMHERSVQQARAQEAAFQSYVRQTVSTSSAADELAKLTDLKAKGAISDAEFEQAKARVLG